MVTFNQRVDISLKHPVYNPHIHSELNILLARCLRRYTASVYAFKVFY